MEATPAAPLPVRPKLRDSCNACSESKVKCNRGKPTCLRCAKRGLLCEYLVTRRAGRKHDKRPRSNTTSSNSPQQPPPYTPEQSVFGTPIPMLDFFDSDQSTSLNSLTVDFDSFLGSPTSFPLLDPPNSLLTSPNQSAQGSSNGSYLEAHHLFEEQLSTLPIDLLPTIYPDPKNLAAGQNSPNGTCGCLVNALEMFRQLLPPSPTGSRRTNSLPYGRDLMAESIVATNARTVDAITQTLHCQCAHDEFLLVIVFMAAFKVMNWYASAARGSNSDLTSDDVTTTSLGEDPARLTAQSVLSELHRMQKLVNALSAKVKRFEPGEKTGDQPFSSTVLHQLELDLRQKIRALSIEIVDILKR